MRRHIYRLSDDTHAIVQEACRVSGLGADEMIRFVFTELSRRLRPDEIERSVDRATQGATPELRSQYERYREELRKVGKWPP